MLQFFWYFFFLFSFHFSFFFLSLSLFSFLFSFFSFFFFFLWGKKNWGSKKVGVKNGLYINISNFICHHGTMVQLHNFIQWHAGSNPVGGKSHLWSRCSRRNFGLNCYRSTNILKTVPYFKGICEFGEYKGAMSVERFPTNAVSLSYMGEIIWLIS